jgi:cobalt/nickel transport system permease protein
MHMADALISPGVGGTMWAASAAVLGYSSRKVSRDADTGRTPLMGVLGAFVFAAQMINFSIPGTGSSGHLGGGLLLAMLLGPHAAFLTMASVLTVQALFFADGGLLALGCNIFNLGFLTAYVAYPLLVRPLLAGKASQGRHALALMAGAMVGLQLGAFGVVLETVLSGRTELPFRTFVLAMQPIHLAIGLVEGAVTIAVVSFLAKARPEMVESKAGSPFRGLLVLGVLTLLVGGVLSWWASSDPDGLEWATQRITGQAELQEPETPFHAGLAGFQKSTAFLPDYSFKNVEGESRSGTSTAGIVGGLITLALAAGLGFVLSRRKRAA